MVGWNKFIGSGLSEVLFRNMYLDVVRFLLIFVALTHLRAHWGLRQFLATESPLKMIKNTFYFTSKAIFVLKIFKFLSWLIGHVANPLDKKY